jgi:RNA polymerase sigma-70 factor (ECF subfamily)
MEASAFSLARLPSTAEAATMPRVAVIQPTDEDLLSRVAEGDRDAFGDLYKRYSRAVLGLALRRLGDRGRAEDAVQEAFASVWRAARSYKRERGPVAPWLYAVARNAIADRGRARVEPPAEPGDTISDEAGPADKAEQSWVAWRVHRALEELPEAERTVLDLAYWGELSQSEIADFLGIPLGTVKTRTRSGLRRLADELEGELE